MESKLKNKIEKVKDVLGFDEREALISKTKERNALVEKNSIDKRNYKDYQIKLKYDDKNVDVKNQYNKAASQYMKSTSKLTVANAQAESFMEKYAKTPVLTAKINIISLCFTWNNLISAPRFTWNENGQKPKDFRN